MRYSKGRRRGYARYPRRRNVRRPMRRSRGRSRGMRRGRITRPTGRQRIGYRL